MEDCDSIICSSWNFFRILLKALQSFCHPHSWIHTSVGGLCEMGGRRRRQCRRRLGIGTLSARGLCGPIQLDQHLNVRCTENVVVKALEVWKAETKGGYGGV
jgi:hypothetical protein